MPPVTRALGTNDGLQELEAVLLQSGFDKVEELLSLMKSCHLRTLCTVRLFKSNLKELVAQLFDTSTRLGQLEAQGYAASLKVPRT
ncbi:MAG: hypothetical protein SGPRY_006627 [Prymnesium sp.]